MRSANRRVWGGGKYWKFRGKLLGALAVIALAGLSFSKAAVSKEDQVVPVSADSSGHLNYVKDAKGNSVPDFSFAGYMGGGVKLPDVAVKITLSADAASKDDSTRIQAALDAIAKLPP